MARTLLTPTVVDRTGTINMPAAAALDAVNNNNFTNNGRIFINVQNSGGVTYTFTVVLANTTLPDTQPGGNLVYTGGGVVYSLAAAATILLGPFPPVIYNQSDGTVWVNPQNAALKYVLIQLN